MRVVILSGAPGSGKSTCVNQWETPLIVCSADSYFTDVHGVYRFDPKGIQLAHMECLRRFLQVLQAAPANQPNWLVVDNTNTALVEVAPYVRLAQAFGHAVDIQVFLGQRNNVHGVPEHKVRQMRDRCLLTWEDDTGGLCRNFVSGSIFTSRTFRCDVIFQG